MHDSAQELNPIIRLILVEEIVQNNQKIVSICCFRALGHPQMDPKELETKKKMGPISASYLKV
jgi:hypothetical protein